MPRILTICVASLLCFVVMMLPGQVTSSLAAEQERWSPPFPVSGIDPRAGGWFPSITADIYGHVHVVWNGRAPLRPASTTVSASQRVSDAAGWLIYASWDRQRWSPPNEVAAIGDEGDALRSALTSDPNGRLHLLYRGLDLRAPAVGGAENEPMRYISVESLEANQLNSWSVGAVLSHHLPAYYSDIVSDSRGNLHALMTEPGDDKQYTVFYRRSEDGGRSWSSPVAIETELAVSRWRLQLKLGQNDELHAVWEVIDPDDPTSRLPVGFVYARSIDQGQTWTTAKFAPRKEDFSYPKMFDGTRWRIQPAVGVDGRGQIVLVWREFETNQVYFQRSTDGREWSAPQRVGGITKGVARPFDRYDMATDSAGRLHLVMVAYTDNTSTMALLHIEWLGYSWGDPEVITRASIAPFPEWPRIAISEGNRLHVVWFGGSSSSVERIPVGIWYSSKVTSAPIIPAVSVPERPAIRPGVDGASVPTGVPTIVPRLPATPEPVRNLQPLATVDSLQPASWPIVAGILGGSSVLVLFVVARRFGHDR